MKACFTPAPGKSEQAKLKLLAAALHFFSERGLEGATVREIAKAAGQNVAAIAYYFGSKDNLYGAVMESIVREIRHQMSDVLTETRTWRQGGGKSPAEALRLLKNIMSALYLRVVSRNEMKPMARLIIREQMQPTAGFEVLYHQGFREVHALLSYLVGTALERNPREREIIARTHAIMGQVYFFAIAREAILRRMGWRDLEGRNATMVANLIKEHIEVLITALAGKRTQG